jgi:hypothetical protein
MFNKTQNDRLLTGAMLTLLTVNLALLFWYVFFGYQVQFHSDSAAKVLLAREIYDTGVFFPPDWNYVNDDVWVLFGHVFIVPLLAFMPAGFTAHAVSGALFACLILYGVWLVTGLSNLHIWRRLLVVAVMAAGISEYMAENLFGQVSYGSVVFFCCCLVFFASKYLVAHGQQGLKWGALFVVILILAFWGNPSRATVTYSLPMIGALVWLVFSAQVQNKRKYLVLIGLSLIGAVAGSVLHSIILTGLSHVQGASNARWLPFELVLGNISLTLKGLFALLGGLPIADASLFSKNGLYSGIRFFVACLTLILIPLSIVKAVQSACASKQLLALFSAFLFSFTLFIHLTTTIPDMVDPIGSSRYLVPGLVLCIIVLLMSPLKWVRPPFLVFSVSVVTLVFISGGFATYQLASLPSGLLTKPKQLIVAKRHLIELLESNNLQYGYSSFWNAGALTVLSNEKIKIRQILIHQGLPVPHRWLSSNRWFRPSAWNGETFLLLHDKEVDLVDWTKMQKLGLGYKKKLILGEYSVFIFEKNIALYLPNWDTRYEKPAMFFADKNALSQTGRLIGDKDNARFVAEKGESGALYHGPYIDVEPGRYRVTFDVQAERNVNGVIRLDVVSAPDQKQFGEKTLNESVEPQVIEFTIDTKQIMEFRVWALGNEKVVFKGVSIVRLPM